MLYPDRAQFDLPSCSGIDWMGKRLGSHSPGCNSITHTFGLNSIIICLGSVLDKIEHHYLYPGKKNGT